MPRTRTRPTTHTLLRLDVRQLRHAEMWHPGYITRASITRSGLPPVVFQLDYTTDAPAILHQEQHIPLVAMPSNIGRGLVWYFVCPITGRRCRALYYLQSARLLVSRQAIHPGPVYASQSYGVINMYHHLSKRLEQEKQRRTTTTYRGKATRRAERVARLEERVDEYNLLAWEGLLNYAARSIPKHLGYGK